MTSFVRLQPCNTEVVFAKEIILFCFLNLFYLTFIVFAQMVAEICFKINETGQTLRSAPSYYFTELDM